LDLPLILAGPILRRVEPNLVAVWVALRDACTLRLALWEDQLAASDASDSNLWFRSPDPGAKTVRLGEKLHLAVVTLRLPEGKTLAPERLYSYDLEIAPQGQAAKSTLKSLGLLANDPPNADPEGANTRHLALGYEPDLLPCLVLPPKELRDLKLAHGSCRSTDNPFVDGLPWLDDLLRRDSAYKSATMRPHQLFLTGDQIYADEVSRPLLHMLGATAATLFGATQEQLPFRDQSQPPAVVTAPASLTNFPVGRRANIISNEAGMTSTGASGHLMSFGEFCAMYLFVWSNVPWGDQLAALPPPAELLKKGAEAAVEPPALRELITKTSAGEEAKPAEFGTGSNDYRQDSYDRDVARLVEFRRTLPKVRRALANVPTYMIFDDHEITDDWFLNMTWRDRVLASPLGRAIVRNGMLAYALFQGWGNDPLKFEPRAGVTEQQPHEELLALAPQFLPAGATSGPDTAPGGPAAKIEELLGLNQRNAQKADGSFAETEPKLKWFYTVPGTRHQVIVLDCRTRRSFASRISPPGNIGEEALKEQIPSEPTPEEREVSIIVSSLPVLGPPIFDELFAPLLFRMFDAKDAGKLQRNRGTALLPGTNPDAVEGWSFDPKRFEELLARLRAYSPVVVLSGDVHYSATNAMSYWFKERPEDAAVRPEPARVVQFIASGLKNVMPPIIVFVNRSLAIAQKMTRSKVGAERLAWAKGSPSPLTLKAGGTISPRLRSLLRKSPLLLPTRGWGDAVENPGGLRPDWAWRVSPIVDTRPDKDRPPMARPASLFPDDTTKQEQDIARANLDGHHRVAERHARQLQRLNNSRQLLFAPALGIVSFEKRTVKDRQQREVEVVFAIQDLYTVQRDPANLTEPPVPLAYTRHEVPLRDLTHDVPAITPPVAPVP
jgi:hypothetical protein